MTEINASMVKDLRERTGAGMMDCKKALSENGGDFTKAEEWLRKKGISRAAAKGGRVAAEGLVGTYMHSNGRLGVLVEVNCETDFVARNEDFQGLVKEVAMQIAGATPRWVRREEVPGEIMAKEKEIFEHELREAKKPEAIWEKIITGKLEKFYEVNCLVDQVWIKDDKKKIKDMLIEKVAKIGENITVRRFARFEVGEGIEKKKEDLAAEVAKTIGASA
jgi:elongation factor Ts